MIDSTGHSDPMGIHRPSSPPISSHIIILPDLSSTDSARQLLDWVKKLCVGENLEEVLNRIRDLAIDSGSPQITSSHVAHAMRNLGKKPGTEVELGVSTRPLQTSNYPRPSSNPDVLPKPPSPPSSPRSTLHPLLFWVLDHVASIAVRDELKHYLGHGDFRCERGWWILNHWWVAYDITIKKVKEEGIVYDPDR